MSRISITNARILTIAGDDAPRRRHSLRELGVIDDGWISMAAGLIEGVGPSPAPAEVLSAETVINAQRRVVMPAFVDCHTHACWAGDRFDEFEAKLAGATYLDILNAGGGIMSTVRAVRAATEEELTEHLLERLARMAACGTGSAEVKSGYGLSTTDELKMLRAIRAAAGRTDVRIQPTFLGAHAIDPANGRFVDEIIDETLPAVVVEFPHIPCDAYVETGAWSVNDARRLFEAAQSYGCPIRVHADQFNSLGMTMLAVEMGARSVDHLEAVTPHDLEHLARSETIGVVLPCSGFQLDGRYAPARALADAGGAIAIATNYNPGSAPCPSMPFAIALAARALRLTVAECIVATTHNAACVLGVQDVVGSIRARMAADVQILDCTDERELAYEFGASRTRALFLGGKCVFNHIDHSVGRIE